MNEPLPIVRNESEIFERLDQIQRALNQITRERTVKDFYTVCEFAALVGRRPFTVRQWCNEGRIAAIKSKCGRGPSKEWRISHAELLRYQNYGLLPDESHGSPRIDQPSSNKKGGDNATR